MSAALSDQLAIRVRALLRSAEHPTSAAGTTQDWRATRDAWLDALDPREGPELSEADIRGLIDFLSEAGPSRSSRRTPAEWSTRVDALIPELLFASQAPRR